MQLLEEIAKFISPTHRDYAELSKETEKVTKLIATILGDGFVAIPFGSFARHTMLAEHINPAIDVDLLVAFKLDFSGNGKNGNLPNHLLEWSKEIAQKLANGIDSSEYEVQGNAPFLTIKSGACLFDLTFSTTAGGDPRTFPHTILFEQKGYDASSQKPLDKYTSFATITDLSERYLLLVTPPLPYDVDQLSGIYGEAWRSLILVWKYWKVKSGSQVSSWMIEKNILDKLTDSDWITSFRDYLVKRGDGLRFTSLMFAAFFLQNTSNYDFDRFKAEPNFVYFAQTIVSASALCDQKKLADAVRMLARVFPFEVLEYLLEHLDYQ